MADGVLISTDSIPKLRKAIGRKYRGEDGIRVRFDGDTVVIGLTGRVEPNSGSSRYIPGTIAGSSAAEGAPEDVTYSVTLRDGTSIGDPAGGLIPMCRTIHAPSTTAVVAAPIGSDCVLELGDIDPGPPTFREVRIVVCEEYLKTRPCATPAARPFVGLDFAMILTDKRGLPLTDKRGALLLTKQATSQDELAAGCLLTDKRGLPLTDKRGLPLLDKRAVATAEAAWRTVITDKRGQVVTDRRGTISADKRYTGD
jgi:hypothetical protein